MIGLQEDWTGFCILRWPELPCRPRLPSERAGDPPIVPWGAEPSRSCWPARIAAGCETTTWFERHGSTLVTEIPSHWPEDYRRSSSAASTLSSATATSAHHRATRYQAALEHAGLGRP